MCYNHPTDQNYVVWHLGLSAYYSHISVSVPLYENLPSTRLVGSYTHLLQPV